MSNFKDRLWEELVREHGARLANVRSPVGKPVRRARPRLLAGTTLTLAGLGAATVLVLGAASSSPAFAVSRHRDGTIAVTIKAVGGIRGANARLAEIGVPARAVEVAPGCPARTSPAALRRAVGGLVRMGVAPGNVQISVTARFDPRRIPPGRTLVFPIVPRWRAGGNVQIAPGRVLRGRPPACLPFAPPPFPGPPGVGPGGRGFQCAAAPVAGPGRRRLSPKAGPPAWMHCRGARPVGQCIAGPLRPGEVLPPGGPPRPGEIPSPGGFPRPGQLPSPGGPPAR